VPVPGEVLFGLRTSQGWMLARPGETAWLVMNVWPPESDSERTPEHVRPGWVDPLIILLLVVLVLFVAQVVW
jgi:hypothetical protein